MVAVATLAFVVVVAAEAIRVSTRPTRPSTPRPTALDHTSVEHMIEQGGYTGVVCNNAVDPVVRTHISFSCHADGGHRIVVTIVNAEGNYVWTATS